MIRDKISTWTTMGKERRRWSVQTTEDGVNAQNHMVDDARATTKSVQERLSVGNHYSTVQWQYLRNAQK